MTDRRAVKCYLFIYLLFKPPKELGHADCMALQELYISSNFGKHNFPRISNFFPRSTATNPSPVQCVLLVFWDMCRNVTALNR